MMDLAIVGVLLLFTVMGWRSGLIRGLVGLAAMVLALVLSAQLARAAAPEIVDRYLRPATYAAIEERAEELSRRAVRPGVFPSPERSGQSCGTQC